MIVRDAAVEAALAYLNLRPHPVAVAQYELMRAENECKRVFANVFLKAQGSVEYRKAVAETDQNYMDAKGKEALATKELIDQKEQKNGAEFIIEAWRTEQSNIRAA